MEMLEPKKELRVKLYQYLGDLMYLKANTSDWMEYDKIIGKMNAVYLLLDIDKVEKNWYQKTLDEKTKNHKK